MDEQAEEEKRCQFGNRFLTDPSNVFAHNAWDNVEWDEEQEQAARSTVEKNSNTKLGPDAQLSYEVDSAKNWDNFYAQHQNRFFKDRHWLFTEFPELETSRESNNSNSSEKPECVDDKSRQNGMLGNAESFPGESAKIRMLEVGCGVGNTVFPVLETNNDPHLFMYCCDLSDNAIQLVRENKDYDPRRCHAFVCDVSNPDSTFPFPDESLDFVILIFVLSAINPEKLPSVISRLSRALKPGGVMLFRDYGRYDLTQLRFKIGRCLGDNFYVRGDGTKVYFFTQEELKKLFTESGGLEEEQNLIDRRLQLVWKELKCNRLRFVYDDMCTVHCFQAHNFKHIAQSPELIPLQILPVDGNQKMSEISTQTSGEMDTSADDRLSREGYEKLLRATQDQTDNQNLREEVYSNVPDPSQVEAESSLYEKAANVYLVLENSENEDNN